MIHEMKEEFFKLPLQNYILTFDDGLHSQYRFRNDLLKIDTPKIFFITTNIVALEDTQQNSDCVSCTDAHDRFFSVGDVSNYMNWEQIRSLYNSPQCFIGGHGHNHLQLWKNTLIVEKIRMCLSDTANMINTFNLQIGSVPDRFCFPYNYVDELHMRILQGNSISKFYSKKRIPIEWL